MGRKDKEQDEERAWEYGEKRAQSGGEEKQSGNCGSPKGLNVFIQWVRLNAAEQIAKSYDCKKAILYHSKLLSSFRECFASLT